MSTDNPPSTTERGQLKPQSKWTGVMPWHRRALSFCLILFATELGLVLLVYPWRMEWELSWIPIHSPQLTQIWMSRYLRGAVSGLGLLNLYVAFAELRKQVSSLFAAR